MPWPWKAATACLDFRTGTIINWPWPADDFTRNEFVLDAMYRVWRVWNLFHKPTMIAGKSNWTPEDVDLYAWLQEQAWTVDDA